MNDAVTKWSDKLDAFHIGLICGVLGIIPQEIDDIYTNPGRGINNDTFVIAAKGKTYLYRLPGKGTELFCDRDREYDAYMRLREYAITDELVYFEPRLGIKMSVYYPGSHVTDVTNDEELRLSMELIHRFHNLPVEFPVVDTPYMRLGRYNKIAEESAGKEHYPEGFEGFLQEVLAFKPTLDRFSQMLCPCHGDCLPNNVLFPCGKPEPILIDFEFPAMSDPYGDLAAFCHDGELKEDACLRCLDDYLGRPAGDLEKFKLFGYIAVVAAMWCCWSSYKAAVEKNVEFYDGYSLMSYHYAEFGIKLAKDFLPGAEKELSPKS